jgi:F-box and WD-40 domain protein CDC4
MRNDILVTGGSDGSVRVWSLSEFQAIHRLAAHDNSVTSLQFDDTRIVSGGSDGRVKIWDLKKGTLVSELSQPADAVWRVVFEEEKAVLLASRNQKTVMEVNSPVHAMPTPNANAEGQVWSFSPPEDELSDDFRSSSPIAISDHAVDYLTQEGSPRHSRRPASEDISMIDAFSGDAAGSTSTDFKGKRRR